MKTHSAHGQKRSPQQQLVHSRVTENILLRPRADGNSRGGSETPSAFVPVGRIQVAVFGYLRGAFRPGDDGHTSRVAVEGLSHVGPVSQSETQGVAGTHECIVAHGV